MKCGSFLRGSGTDADAPKTMKMRKAERSNEMGRAERVDDEEEGGRGMLWGCKKLKRTAMSEKKGCIFLPAKYTEGKRKESQAAAVLAVMRMQLRRVAEAHARP